MSIRGRRTKIVCTLGPASSSEAQVEALLGAGMDVARINCSHGTPEEHAATIARVRAAAARQTRAVAILLDLQGPKIRTGPLAGGVAVHLRDDQPFVITTEPVAGTAARVSTTYSALGDDVRPGDRVLLADGAIELRVTGVARGVVATRVVHGGLLAEHQGINLPGISVSASALTPKDREDVRFGVEQQVDFIALSFVRRPEDVTLAREVIAEAAAHMPAADSGQAEIPIIAKVERPEAVEHLDAILRLADGVMVARGDLGVEMPLEHVPLIQKRIIARARALGRPVITATQMLESMIERPRPTRAEVSDVANAILDGTDAVMLSGETAVGVFPTAATEMMARIAEETDVHGHGTLAEPVDVVTPPQALASAAHTLARAARARLIAVFTRTGTSAQLISRERPDVPIIAYTPHDAVCRRLALWWGVEPRHSALAGTTEELIGWVAGDLRTTGTAVAGEAIVILGGMPVAQQAPTNFVKLHTLA